MLRQAMWVAMLLLTLGGCQAMGPSFFAKSGPSTDRALAEQVENDPFPSAHQVHLAAK